jgi:diadenosine tetraphosphate (Ap4A) HIT family hydrolase
LSKSQRVELTDLLLGEDVQWPKPLHHGEPVHVAPDEAIVYEDDHVVAFMESDDDPQEEPRAAGEIRVTLMPKRHVTSLLDLGVDDERLSIAILSGIQQVAYRLGLLHKGFEVRCHVLPPLQHRPQLAFKIRSGKPPKSSDEGAG